MSKLQVYYDYFEKYYGVENWGWYQEAKEWSDIVTKIKSEISSLIPDERTEDNINKILLSCSNDRINSIHSFFDIYLFEQANGLGNIKQGVIWNTVDNPHIDTIKRNINFDVFIRIITQRINEVDSILEDELLTINRDCQAAKIRLLRALFPEQIAAVDAPNKLDRVLGKIKSKLGIDYWGSGNRIEQMALLMNSVDSDNNVKKQIFFWELYYILENPLQLKRAIVYYGAPGTGKTYKSKITAKRYIDQFSIKLGIKKQEDYKIKTVQFHPSYSYEDFFEGIRPSDDKSLKLFNGTFKSFCKEISVKEISLYKNEEFLKNEEFRDRGYDFSQILVSELTEEQKQILDINEDLPEGITISEVIEPAFFIIDEINRAELSRVFGELMYSLEYRGYAGKIKTQYSYLTKSEDDETVFYWEDNENWFFIPQNLILIGTMNNIDRSVDSFDFALRRRFSWEEVEPDFNIIRHSFNKSWKDNLAESFEKLNEKIYNDELLGKDYRIGHSYAISILPIQERFDTANEVKEFIWNEFIKSLLQEYLRGLGNENKSRERLEIFKKEFGI